MIERLFFTSSDQSRYTHVRMCATLYPISWIMFILDLGTSYTDSWNSDGYKLRTPRSLFIFIMLRKRFHGFS